MSTYSEQLGGYTGTISSEITETLRDAIITGEISQGSKLSENKLAKDFDVSRGPLREAIRNLEGMNLIVHVPQQGARVVTLSMELILEIYDTREALESKAASLAAANLTSGEIDELHRIIDAQSKHMRDNSNSYIPAESDYDFHDTLVRGAKNKVIESALLRKLYPLIKMFRYQHEFASTSTTNSLQEHRQIVYAIEQRDTELAGVTVKRHIIRARDRIERRLTSIVGDKNTKRAS